MKLMHSHESGRSMVEMLGVLAIVGVLSVGGIAGYSQAMSKFKITKAMDQVQTIITNMRTLYASSRTYSALTANAAYDVGHQRDIAYYTYAEAHCRPCLPESSGSALAAVRRADRIVFICSAAVAAAPRRSISCISLRCRRGRDRWARAWALSLPA